MPSGCITGCLYNNNQTNVQSTIVRGKLEGVVKKTDWYEDKIGWISSKNVLIKGLEDFYKKTGVQPYVLFVPYSSDLWANGVLQPDKADEYLEKVYAEKFDDEGHFIFAYFQCAKDSKTEMEGEFRYLSGYSADTIMDSEAIRIFWGYFETNYYNTSLTIEEMISKTFSKTADSIMSNSKEESKLPMILSIILIVGFIIFIIYILAKNGANKKKVNKPENIVVSSEEKDETK